MAGKPLDPFSEAKLAGEILRMKKYYLYRLPILKKFEQTVKEWYFDDEFSTYEEAFNKAKANAKRSCWKVWKIEEVLDFEA